MHTNPKLYSKKAQKLLPQIMPVSKWSFDSNQFCFLFLTFLTITKFQTDTLILINLCKTQIYTSKEKHTPNDNLTYILVCGKYSAQKTWMLFYLLQLGNLSRLHGLPQRLIILPNGKFIVLCPKTSPEKPVSSMNFRICLRGFLEGFSVPLPKSQRSKSFTDQGIHIQILCDLQFPLKVTFPA